MRRVVITGLGAVSPHGLGAPALWNGLVEGKSSIASLTRFDPGGFPCRVAAVVPPFKTTDFVPRSYRKATKIMARDIEMAVVAADFAVKDARLVTRGIAESTPESELVSKGWFKPNPARVGCNIGAGLICADLNELTAAMAEVRNPDDSMDLARWGRSEDPTKTSGMDKLTPVWLLKYLPNMLACHVSIIHDTQGPSNTITCGHASAGLALAEATRTIQRGKADLALAGGFETRVHPMGIMRWSLLGLLNEHSNDQPAAACRPYDKTAAGVALGEGGAVLVIEELEHAQRRGATIYAEITGLGITANASSCPIEPDPTGDAEAAAIRKALGDAATAPEAIDLIVPPGHSIPTWDQTDAAAFKKVFGAHLGRTTVFPARAGMGDCGAGSQAIDLVAAALALHQQAIPGTPNVTDPIDGLPISCQTTRQPVAQALVLGAALGGQNCAIILKRIS